MEKKPVYLVMVTTENNNKFYNFKPNANGTFTAEWGRVGGRVSTKDYPMSKWDSQLNSKLKKGYINNTELMEEVIENSVEEKPSKNEDEFSVVKDNSVRTILKRLFDYANQTIQKAYNIQTNVVTQAMVDKAQKMLDELTEDAKNISVEDFNDRLIKLFTVIPRKMHYVQDCLASNTQSFGKILNSEQSILDTMAGQVYKAPKKLVYDTNTDVKTVSILDKMGIAMEDATEEDIAKIKKAMGDSAGKFHKAWRVTNFETEERYKKFIAENHIGNVKLLCHGSRNQNWFNIIKMGLKFRPAGVITTGLMWGAGLYWSNPEKYHGGVAKSIGYTSLGGYWTRDYQDSGFIAFFDVALGESEEAWEHSSKYYGYNLDVLHKNNPKAWSLWCHGNTNSLRNDEIIVYSDKQMTIRYLVEIK